MERRRAIKATIWSFVATIAFAFGFVLPYRGRQDTLDFITGFLVEKSLSVDNLFVFLMIFEYFKGTTAYSRLPQHISAHLPTPMRARAHYDRAITLLVLLTRGSTFALRIAFAPFAHPTQCLSIEPSASCDGASSLRSCCAAS